MSRRFLNVQYAGRTTRIPVSADGDLGEIQCAIKMLFGERIPGPAIDIQLCDEDNNRVIDADKITDEYFKKLLDGGAYLTIRTSSFSSQLTQVLSLGYRPVKSPSTTTFATLLNAMDGLCLSTPFHP
jgi:hypothetical protein